MATAEGLDAWFTSGAVVDARPGGRIVFRWHEWGPDRVSGEDGGVVVAAERPGRFVFRWSPDEPGYATTVELSFTRTREGTAVRVREHGYRDTPAGRRKMLECAAGWGEALTLMKLWVERGIGLERR
jgi:uncharacterized protein YndB with AHSA1/START domain